MLTQIVPYRCVNWGNFCSASPNQWQSVSSPQYLSSAASYVITLLQQLADLCCVSQFVAVCTTVTLHCEVAVFIGNVHLIILCESQGHVVCLSLILQVSDYRNLSYCYYYFSGLLARSYYSEDPATGHHDTGFSWFPCVYKQMLRSLKNPKLRVLAPYVALPTYIY